MPNAASTQASSASETTGTPIPLAYGYQWVTGKRHAYYMLQETGTPELDYMRAGIWLLGHGEWDGPMEIWINDLLCWKPSATTVDYMGWRTFSTLDSSTQNLIFNWHSGCDSVIGSGLTPSSLGPDQGCDQLWSVFPPAVQPLCFSRICYYTLMRKQPILYQQNSNMEDPSQWTDVNPIGLWRGLRCRIFDGDGNVLGYAFTRNPVWHWVDVTLRRELFPDYNLIYESGPDPLPAAVSARFNWGKIYDAAQYCNAIVASGQPRFTGDYSFATQTSLQAIKGKILRACRAFEQESQGMIAPVIDQPRASVFTFSRDHILPGSWNADDTVLNTAGNRLLPSFRDVLVPACSSILSISNPLQGAPLVTTDSIPPTGTPQPHPFQQGDNISIGGTGTIFDGEWVVNTVPDIIDPGTPSEVDPSTFTMIPKGNNYPTSLGAVGVCGLLYSRFKERTPEFWHKNNMLARGAYALNLARQRNKVKDALDFDTSTYDQVSRVSRYERDRNLGFDVSPYVPPARLKFRVSMFAKDVNGALACGIETGDRVTLDDTLRWPYAGDYEVVDPLTKDPPRCSAESAGASLALAPDSNSGEVTLSLQTYDEDYFYDTSDPEQAGWLSVPGSYPGNDSSFSGVPLANGGNFVFFVGQAYSGSAFQLPSTGYPPGNLLAWASPAGSNPWESLGATRVETCWVDNYNMVLTLIYADDDGHIWYGTGNYAALTWIGQGPAPLGSDDVQWLDLILAGGEEILFGFCNRSDGDTLTLPSGWSTDQVFATAYISVTDDVGSVFYLAGAWVDSDLVVHCECQNHSGTTWTGSAHILIFAWKNNMGTVTSQTIDGATWLEFPLSDGSKLGVGLATEVANGATLTLPTDAGSGETMAAMVGPSDSFYTSSDATGAQGIGTCYLDAENVVHATFNNSSGTVWPGTADIFAIYTVPATTPAIVVSVAPRSTTMSQASTASFSAAVSGSSNQSVTWSVDGVAGGNATVGTIDGDGNYTAPASAGSHTITATSVADDTVTGTASAVVTTSTSLQVGVTGTTVVTTAPSGSTVTLQPVFSTNAVALAAPNGGTTYTVGDGTPVALANPEQTFYFVNGAKVKYGLFYTISGTTLTLLIPAQAPQSGDVHELFGS